jgi:hypothetical protein
MGTVRAAFLITIEADDDDYAGFVSPATIDWSHAEVRSWLYQNYFERIGDALEVQDRPATLTWTVDSIDDVDAALKFQYDQWNLADAIVNSEGFRSFVERNEALDEIGRIGQEQDAHDQQVYNYENDHTIKVRGYRDFL